MAPVARQTLVTEQEFRRTRSIELHMRNLMLTVRAFCVIPFVTSSLDLIDGVGLLKKAGVPLDEGSARDPMLNSQIRFFGAIWLGYGIVLWRASSRLRTEADLFKLLCGILGLSGLARLASAFQYGFPGVPLGGAILLEIVGSAGALRWHASLLRRPDPDEAR